MSYVVPFEVQMEIAKRVDDVSSLVRFRSVSKEWKSFIDSREFIAGYGFRHTQPSRFMLRYLHYQEEEKEDDLLDEFGEIIRTGTIWFSELEKYICVVDNDDGFTLQHDFPPFLVVPDLIQQLKRDKIVLGMSRGLFCMHGLDINSGRATIVIWNPSLRKSVGILVPDHVPHKFDFDSYGFGVCPVTYDPTIIKISYPAQSITWQVKIFTLSSKRWDVIISSSNLPRKSIRLDSHNQVVIDRFIYWVAMDLDAEHNSFRDHNIMSFDLITHEFKEINFPDSLVNEVYIFLTISKLRESLVVSAHVDMVTKIVCGVWMMVMEDDGNVASFNKMFNFDMIDTSVEMILEFMKRGEPVLESQQELEESDLTVVEAYEPWLEHMTNLRIYGVEYGSFFMDSFVFCLITRMVLYTQT